MPSKKKKFINKKEAVTFHLVHRSQKDPLQASEDASKHVLVEGGNESLEKRQEEQRKYGVFYDDEYNYLQHLKEADEVYELEADSQGEPMHADEKRQTSEKVGTSINLPSSVFASEFEKPVGLLNEAVQIRGPQPNWDPDIVEGLDDDFDFDDPNNQLDDDFIVMANQDGPGWENGGDRGKQYHDDGSDLENVSDLDSNEANMSDSDDFDADFQYGDKMFMNEETKSRFTDYSVSSSVIRRNEGLTLLDDRFEKLYEGYDDSEIGALDQEEIDGCIQQGSEVLNRLVEQFEKQQNLKKLGEVIDENVGEEDVDVVSDDSDSDTELVQVEGRPEEKWDCESILSTYSNIYNHPTLITEPKKHKGIKLIGPHGIPEDISTRGLTQQQITEDMLQRERSDKASTYRPKGETAEERAERKKAVKNERKERRQEKKQNKMAFTSEKIRQDKEVINLNTNLKNVKIV